jgi:phosphoglycolate phosphatase-like HAD superfamily hydrolase
MMVAQYKDRIEEIIADRDRISLALAEGVRDALKHHKQAGNPIVVMLDGKMVWLKPEEIQA